MINNHVFVIEWFIIPITGELIVTPSNLANSFESGVDMFDLIASIIVDKMNPPNGVWGSFKFKNDLLFYLESHPDIFKVDISYLKISNLDNENFSEEEKSKIIELGLNSNQDIDTIVSKKWFLYQIQSDLKVITE